MASDWDKGSIYFAGLFSLPDTSGTESRAALEKKYQAFLEHFYLDGVYIYREQLRRNLHLKQYYLIVDQNHIIAYDENLSTQLLQYPTEAIGLLELAVKRLALQLSLKDGLPTHMDENDPSHSSSIEDITFQIQLTSSDDPSTIRQLDSSRIGRAIRIFGIVISASTPVAKPTTAYIVCKNCGSSKTLPVQSSFGGVSLPRTCPGPSRDSIPLSQSCPLDPYVIVADKCRCVDQQTLKLQEAPDMVPVGELPRHVLVTVDRYLVNKVAPGHRITITGVYSIFQHKGSSSSNSSNTSGVAIRTPYIKALGIEAEGTGRSFLFTFTEDQERQMIAFSRQSNIYERISKSIAPSIYGNDDIKKALACLLFGGSRKHLPDRLSIRGDINVLLLGDPGTAKSQFLKFIEKVSPVSVYTSGKGSSAAGLTASVIRDPASGEFYLEGGAMVLADGGVVCIDEFDKMRDEDRVAIHEAMEQQTISIAKAGITTVLSTRASVLAAANPIFGRYDEMKTPGENIDFSTTILSRFDMIFIVKDDHNQQRDISLAKHVLSVHMNPNAVDPTHQDIDLATLKQYIAYCKARCAPRLTQRAASRLSDYYVNMRSQVHEMEMDSTERSSIPITVRQLEAIIRISEALAKMSLSSISTEEHVDEAVRLFRASTMQAVNAGHSLEGMIRPELIKEIEKVERILKSRLPIGSTVSYSQILRELVNIKGFSENAVVRCIDMMVMQEKLIFRNQRRTLVRQP